MTYFQHSPEDDQQTPRRVFQQPVADDSDWAEDLGAADFPDDLQVDDFTEEEASLTKAERQARVRLLAGVSDFLLIVLGVIAVIALSALILALVMWFRRDITERLPVLENLTGAARILRGAGGVHGIL